MKKEDELLLNSVEIGAPNLIKSALQAGADPNARREDKKKQTALIRAVYWGYIKCVEILITSGADPNQKDADGRTPLTCATEWHQVDIANFLKKNGGRS